MRDRTVKNSIHERSSSASARVLVLAIIVFAASCLPVNAEASYGQGQGDIAEVLQSLKDQVVSLSRDMADVVHITVRGEISREEVYAIKAGTLLSAKRIRKEGGSKRFFHIYKIRKSDKVYKRINGKSYKENPNVALSDLRYIKTLYYDFDGKIRSGEIIVNRSIAKDTREVFAELFRIKYQIRKMKLIDSYYTKGGSGTDADTASMNDDNTSAFNYRFIAGTSTLSMHGYGRAIDVNPFENPWCPGGRLYPNQSRSAAYANRGANTGERKPHMIFQDSKITKIFKSHGFRWLGETDTHDYQHFEK